MNDAVEKLLRANSLLLTWFGMAEGYRELGGEPPLEDDCVILRFMGGGASCSVTVGDFRELRQAFAEVVQILHRETHEVPVLRCDPRETNGVE